MRIALIFLLSIFIKHANAQSDADYYSSRFLRYEDFIYVENIKTVQLENNLEVLSDPILRLNSGEQLLLQFDLLENDIEDFSYRFIHCDPDWKPSEISENEYLDGFNSDQISDYKHSLNTTQDYWHYRLLFPNQQMKPIISGNYLLVVFKNFEPDSVVLSKRFFVSENSVDVSANVHRATIAEFRNTHQEVDFKINIKGFRLNNPYADLKIVILQNFNYNTSIKDIKPLFASGEEIDYNLEEGNLFEGGSEYRPLDLRTNKFLTQSIEKIEIDSIYGGMQAILKPDLRLGTQRYSANEDLNGKYLIKIYEGRDAHLEGDYIKVKFRLKAREEETSRSLHIDGLFTLNKSDKSNRLEYNEEAGFYEKTLYIKQGYYNYRYLSSDENGKKSVLETEGSHYETRNEYNILAYWKEPGSRYFKLIANQKAIAGGF